MRSECLRDSCWARVAGASGGLHRSTDLEDPRRVVDPVLEELVLAGGLGLEVLQVAAVLDQLRLDLDDLGVDLVGELLRVDERRCEPDLVRVELLLGPGDGPTELRLEVDQARLHLRGVGVQLRTQVAIRRLGERPAVLSKEVGPVVVLHVLVLNRFDARRVVADDLNQLGPRPLVNVTLRREVSHQIRELVVSHRGACCGRWCGVGQAHPLHRRLCRLGSGRPRGRSSGSRRPCWTNGRPSNACGQSRGGKCPGRSSSCSSGSSLRHC